MSFKTIQTSLDSRGVLTVSLKRPEVRNAFNEEMIHELSQVFSNDVLQSEVRVVVLRGEGAVFCAGGILIG
jgi:methylglutaconyl-CoA hydratase